MHVEVRWELVLVCSILPSGRSQGLNSGHQGWCQVALLAKSSSEQTCCLWSFWTAFVFCCVENLKQNFSHLSISIEHWRTWSIKTNMKYVWACAHCYVVRLYEKYTNTSHVLTNNVCLINLRCQMSEWTQGCHVGWALYPSRKRQRWMQMAVNERPVGKWLHLDSF